jgi:cellobiose-specific phosphotransferase system component IIA
MFSSATNQDTKLLSVEIISWLGEAEDKAVDALQPLRKTKSGKIQTLV